MALMAYTISSQCFNCGADTYHRSDLVQTNEQSWDLNGAAMPRTQTNTTYDAYGSTGPVSPFGHVKTTTNTYSNDTTNWLLGRLTRATVTSSLPNGLSATRTSAFAYEASSGLLTQEIIEPDIASLKLTTSYTLDTFGNRVAVTISGADIATRSSSTQYDAQGRFAVGSTNALGHKETRTFEPGFGNPVSLTGPNGLTTTWAYDGFGRKIQENRADGTQSTFTFNFCANTCPANGVYYTTSTSSGMPTSTVYYDSLNREIRKTTVGFDGRIATVDKLYNSLGQVASTSRPYFPGEAVNWTQFQYDVLGRTVNITEADGGMTQTAYNGLTVSVTNALNHTTQQVKNGLGLVVQTIDAKGNSLAFSFDPFGNPLKTIDPKGNAVTLSYDLRGRKIAMTDPDMGAWSYGYDVLGEMLWQKDAKGQITYVSYDLLGRVVKRQEPGLNSAWTWDSAPKGIGKLAAESSDNGFARSYAYDNYGRLAQTTTSIGGAGTYYQSTVYDGLGRVASFTQPTGLSTVNVYNGNGYLAQVLDGTAQTPYWQAQQVDASGRIILERLGNNLYTQRSFDGMGRPTYISTGKFGVTPDIQNLHLNHDQNGNLISRDDYATQRGDSFVYDELDRLTVDLGPNGKILNYQYDELGNINFKTDVGSYFYGAKPHAVTQISGNINTALQYDANGNQTNGINNRTVAYTAFNLPSQIVQGANTVTFAYDSNHERFRQTGPNGTTVYLNPRMDLGGHFEQTTAGGVVENRHTVYAAGKAIAEVVTRGSIKQTRYFHTDQLGSIDAVTDDNAVVLARYAFDPFGARTPLYGNFSTTRHGFTGHEELPEVGLIHMNGRVYDPALGRFLSADPSIQAPGNLQDYNRYSYALNNPLVFTDPSGFSWFSKFMHSTIGKVITLAAVAAVTILTAGATSAVLTSYTASLGGASVFGATVTTAGVTTLTASTLGSVTIGAVSGFAAGFTGGFLGSGGNFNSGLTGAAYGGLLGAAGGAFSKWTTTDWNFGSNDPTKLTREVFEKYRNINWDQVVLKVGSESLVRGSVYTIMGQDFRKGLLSVYGIIPAISSELYNAYVPWKAQTLGTGDSGAVKDYAEGVLIHRDHNDFGVDAPGSFGSTGGTFSRIMDGYVPGMSSISKIHDVWATYSPLCESNACVTTMLPAAAVTYGSLANWSPTTH
jgi:RHS repeat-associated protein